MLASNATPFAALGFEQKHRDGMDMAVLAVRAEFLLSAEGRLSPAPDQALVLSDEYEGAPQATPLLRVGDLIPWKPAADVTLLGEAHAPFGEPARAWTVGVRVGEHARALRVHAPRTWEPDSGRFRLVEGEPVARAPIDYRSAAGGPVIGDPEGNVDARNPIGAGVIDRHHTPTDRALRAPTVDSERDPIRDALARPAPEGLGPVPPFWESRSRFAGTYDDAWVATRHPQLPEDFDYRFYQTAPPGLILPGFLHGDEGVALTGLVPGGGDIAFALPGLSPWAWFCWRGWLRVSVRLNLDGLHVDLRGEAPWRVALTWRAWVALSAGFTHVELRCGRIADTTSIPGCDERGLAAHGGDT
ncbi:DUF2169 family type VI secretion system accessory protein [Sorangium sp. So ce1335]|uniref:DUF2169 family type VI secretion system accessory protein n=1 Tax=Sorangium sp. So ce1335 TaxID=3133335 RepID=UPI003F5E9222